MKDSPRCPDLSSAHARDIDTIGPSWDSVVERSVYRPGDVTYLAGGRAKGYAVPDAAFMLEYARGPIPGMMPFGIADAVFSTLRPADDRQDRLVLHPTCRR